jgi:hypothetical protein
VIAQILCLITVIEGIALLVVDFISFVYQKITVGIELCWSAFAVVLILLGVVPGLSDWSKTIPIEAVPAFLLISLAIIFSFFYLSCAISQLLRKNQELAMHVSLLNQENEIILQKLKENSAKEGKE